MFDTIRTSVRSSIAAAAFALFVALGTGEASAPKLRKETISNSPWEPSGRLLSHQMGKRWPASGLSMRGGRGYVILWDAKTGKQKVKLSMPDRVPTQLLAFAPNGKSLVCGYVRGRNEKNVRKVSVQVWGLKEEKVLRTIDLVDGEGSWGSSRQTATH